MSANALAKRSGISLPTVQRILSGRHPNASFQSIVAMSKALGIEIELKEMVGVHEFARQSAREKARRLVALVQGTSALEGQAVEEQKIDELTDHALAALLAGSRQKLWMD
jgi:transcriptional regulator with XRE-family HTH domain